MAVRLNSSDTFEPISVRIDKNVAPIAYNNKIEELVEEGCYPTKEEAEDAHPYFELECEIYYEKGYGVFVVEEGAVESGTIYSPYTGNICEEYHEL